MRRNCGQTQRLGQKPLYVKVTRVLLAPACSVHGLDYAYTIEAVFEIRGLGVMFLDTGGHNGSAVLGRQFEN